MRSGWPDLGAAVNAKDLTGHEGSEWAGEEFHDAGDFVDLSDAIEGAVGYKPGFFDLAGPEEAAGACVSGSEGIDIRSLIHL